MFEKFSLVYKHIRGDFEPLPQHFIKLSASTFWLSIKWIVIFVSLLTTPAIQLLYQKF